jgi:NAD(P)H-dependent FMN reductase
MEKVKVAVLLGTTREGSRSGIYANLVKRIGEAARRD